MGTLKSSSFLLDPSQLLLFLFPLYHHYPPIAEDAFLSAIINYTNSSTVHFKLSPTYVLYMTCRYVMSSQYRPDISPSERTHKVIAIVNKMVSMMEGVIQVGVCNFYQNYLLIPNFLQWELCVTLLYYNLNINTWTCRCSSDVEICLWSYIIHAFVVLALKLVSLCFHRFRSLPQQTVLKILHSVFPLCLFVCECLCVCVFISLCLVLPDS